VNDEDEEADSVCCCRKVVNEGRAELRFVLYSLTAYQALKTRQNEQTMKVRHKRFTILNWYLMCSLLPFPFIIVPWSSVSYYLESKANQGRSGKRGKLKGFTSSSQLPIVPMSCIIPAHLNVSQMMLYDQRWKALEGMAPALACKLHAPQI
jgi:hypothetical protein